MTETLIDAVTGKEAPNVGAEANRQAVERLSALPGLSTIFPKDYA